MKFFICISLLVVIIGTAVTAHVIISPNQNYGNDKRLTLDSNDISPEKCPTHKKRVDGICKCADESLKTMDGYCCYKMHSLKNRKKINCHCPKDEVYDFFKNICKQRVKFIFDRR